MLKIYTILFLFLIIFIGAGCSHSVKESMYGQSLTEKNYGRSYETAKYNQIINPEAGKNTVPVTDIDGEASDNNMQKYRDSFKSGKAKQAPSLLEQQ